MALFLLQPGIQPLGQFDVLNTDASTIVGGMIGTWSVASLTDTSTETADADVFDGYTSPYISESAGPGNPGTTTGNTTGYRPVIRIASNTTLDENKAMYLMDEGTANYGTLFGSIIGMYNPSGTVVGPNTMTGSGKVTIWDKPGMFAVSFEACYSNKNVTNGALEAGQDTPLPGDLLYRHVADGKICRLATATDNGGTAANNKIATYVEHASKGALVNTPAKLVGATEVFDRIVINYFGFSKNM
jgi:hypothetical protein